MTYPIIWNCIIFWQFRCQPIGFKLHKLLYPGNIWNFTFWPFIVFGNYRDFLNIKLALRVFVKAFSVLSKISQLWNVFSQKYVKNHAFLACFELFLFIFRKTFIANLRCSGADQEKYGYIIAYYIGRNSLSGYYLMKSGDWFDI